MSKQVTINNSHKNVDGIDLDHKVRFTFNCYDVDL